MPISYKKLWKMLIDRSMSKTDLRNITGISQATIAKLSNEENLNGVETNFIRLVIWELNTLEQNYIKLVEQESNTPGTNYIELMAKE